MATVSFATQLPDKVKVLAKFWLWGFTTLILMADGFSFSSVGAFWQAVKNVLTNITLKSNFFIKGLKDD